MQAAGRTAAVPSAFSGAPTAPDAPTPASTVENIGVVSNTPSRTVRVKNKAPAPVQISAEQLLREAWANREDDTSAKHHHAEAVARHKLILNASELEYYQRKEREDWEKRLSRNYNAVGLWIRYARWEETQDEIVRARSIYERALDTHSRVVSLWLSYAEMEMKAGFVNHARNVLDRSVVVLPREPQLWGRFVALEQMMGDEERARLVFKRWMAWRPAEQAWALFVRFELNHNNEKNARDVFEHYVHSIPHVEAFLKYATFEEKLGHIDAARAVFERMIKELSHEQLNADAFVAFALFETRAGELERARAIFCAALEVYTTPVQMEDQDTAGSSAYEKVMEAYAKFEKQFGERESTEALLMRKKVDEYERLLIQAPADYDIWFEYLFMLQRQGGSPDPVRTCFERAISHEPMQKTEKSVQWRRYIYIWIKYAVWEEVDQSQLERARDVYRRALRAIPHAQFSSTKLWILAAQLELRRKDLRAARRLFGQAMGHCAGKKRVYLQYIELELALGELDRCRKIYEKWIEHQPHSALAWTKYANFEASVHEVSRFRALLELALSRQSMIDVPELLWKTYLDFEMEIGETERTRRLFERLLETRQEEISRLKISPQVYANVFLSYASFERRLGADDRKHLERHEALDEAEQEAVDRVRSIYRRADDDFVDRIRWVADVRGDLNGDAEYLELVQSTRSAHASIQEAWLEFEKSSPLGEPHLAANSQERKRGRAEMGDTALEADKGSVDTPAVPLESRDDSNIVLGPISRQHTTSRGPAEAPAQVSKLIALAQAWKRARTTD